MKRLLLLILAIFALAAPIPALATQAMCVGPMSAMSSMDNMAAHHMSDDSCCDEKKSACMQACDAICVAALELPAVTPLTRTLDPASPPVSTLTAFMSATLANGLDRPPRLIV